MKCMNHNSYYNYSESLGVVIGGCKAGAKIYDLCKLGDTTMTEGLASVYNKSKDGKKVKKGM